MRVAIEQPRRQTSKPFRAEFGNCHSCGKALAGAKPCLQCGSSATAKWIMFAAWFAIVVSLLGLILGLTIQSAFVIDWFILATSLPTTLAGLGRGWIVEIGA